MRFAPISLDKLATLPPREMPARLSAGRTIGHEGCGIPPEADAVIDEAARRFAAVSRLVLLEAGSYYSGAGTMLKSLLLGAEDAVVLLDFETAGAAFQYALRGFAGSQDPCPVGAMPLPGHVAAMLSDACRRGAAEGVGCGQALDEELVKSGAPPDPLFSRLREQRVLVMVAGCTGTDFFAWDPAFDPAAAGEATHIDMRRLAAFLCQDDPVAVLDLTDGGGLSGLFALALAAARGLGATPYGWQWIRPGGAPTPAVFAKRLGDGIELLHIEGGRESILPQLLRRVAELDAL